MKSRALFMMLGVFFFACQKNSTPPELPPGAPELLTRSVITLKIPSNAPAQVTSQTSEGLRDLSFTLGLLDLAAGSRPTGSHPRWNWQASFTPYTLSVTAQRLDAEKVSWEIRLNGSGLSNWLQSSGTTQAENKSGALQISPSFTTSEIVKTSWSKDAQGTFHLETQKESLSYAFTQASDQSGSFTVHAANGIKLFEASWNAAGAGSWTAYDSLTGQVTDSGTWTG